MDDHRLITDQTCIVGSAVVTPLGTTEESVTSLLDGKSAIEISCPYGYPVSVAPFPDLKYQNPKQLASLLSDQLPDLPTYNSDETLVIFAAAKGSTEAVESGQSPENSLLQNQGKAFAEALGLEQSNFLAISNACASGIAAIDAARDYLFHHIYETVIVCGFDLISQFTVTGFHSLSALSPTGARPFDKDRSGMTLGEGAGIVVLQQRVPQLGEIVISGSATTNDANHRTGPSRDGSGLALAITHSLKESGIAPEEIGAIKCHGTATPYNDAMEAKALTSVFGNNQPPAVSFKGNMGHLSGAGSIVETILAAELLKRKQLSGTFGFNRTDCEEPINISASAVAIAKPAMAVLAAGFGGLNACLILKEIQ